MIVVLLLVKERRYKNKVGIEKGFSLKESFNHFLASFLFPSKKIVSHLV
jgi:hypothetical protein